MIIDCHSHLSKMSKAETWENAIEKLISDMRENNIGKRIIIADNVSNSNCADTKRLLELKGGSANLFIIGSVNPFTCSDKDIDYFDQLLGTGKVVGLKIFPGHDKIFANDKSFLSSIDLCLKHDVPLTIHTGINTGNRECAKYNNPKLIVELAKKYPKLKIIIAHYFWPNLDYCFEITSGMDNIYFDTSGLADNEIISGSGSLNKIKLILEKTNKRSPHHIMFGTDYPMCRTDKHKDLVGMLNISASNKENILSKNSMGIFSL